MAFSPKLIEASRNYRRDDLFSDVTAGLIVGIIALPLAMAFAIASGVDPKAGIYTAIVGGLLISLLGGSRVTVGGPTGAFVGIVYGVVANYGLSNLIVCTIMAGVILFVMGAARLGTMIKFIPYPVTTGFTSGIAVVILSTQIQDFFGLKIGKAPPDFIEKMSFLAAHAHTVNWATALSALACLLLIGLWPKSWSRRLPGSIVALIAATFAVGIFGLDQAWGLETIGTRFGGIPRSLPPFSPPSLSEINFKELLRPAITIALLASIESLLCAVIADGMIDDRHDPNQELMAQGIANVGSGLFGGIPATGAIARTVANIRNGGRTPISGVVHALTLMLIVLVAAPLAGNVPLAALSAVLVVVAFNMGEWHHFRRLSRWPKSDAVIFLTTFTITVLVDLVYAVEIGMVLAAVLFIKRVSETTHITSVDERADDEVHDTLAGKMVPEGVMVFKLVGAFLFGAADKLETTLKRQKAEPDVLILRMRTVLAMDATGLNALEDIFEKLSRRGKSLILSAPHTQPYFMLEKAGFIDRIGPNNVCADVGAALRRASQIIEAKKASKAA